MLPLPATTRLALAGAPGAAPDESRPSGIGTTGPAVWQAEEAKTVCRQCPVTTECLAWAFEARVEHGIWGGLTEDERRRLRRR